jgi:putative aldouronate transport system substrate-binding protein
MKGSILFVLGVLTALSITGCKKPADTAAGDSEPVKLTMWAPLLWTGKVSSHDDNIAFQNVQKAANTQLTFFIPPSGQEIENFNLMIASNDLPDMIMTGWSGDSMYVGGVDKYINDGVIAHLNELVENYAPDYLKCINTFVPVEERKEFYTDSGNMGVFYAISPYEEWTYNGLQYRKDWLDELGFQNPETLEEIEKVLTAFRDKKGAASPLIFPQGGIDGNSGTFLTAFGIGPAFYQKNGTVQYGPIQSEFRQYLTLLKDWYDKGLIDHDFPTRDEDAWKRMITTGVSGSIIHSPDTVGDWVLSITPMVGGNYPVQKKGDRVQWRLMTFRARPPYCVAITSACKVPEKAAAFLNYGYTEPGWMEYNYGQEGAVYNKTGETFDINGVSFPKIRYTDMMMKNPEYSILDAIAKYKLHIGPFLRFEHEGNPTVNMNTSAIRQFWTDSADTSMVIPMVSLTPEESEVYVPIMSEVGAYQSTAVLEFILGRKNLNTFDDYVGTIKRLNIDKAIAIQQAALQRYNSR